MDCCGWGTQEDHTDFHTVPELCSKEHFQSKLIQSIEQTSCKHIINIAPYFTLSIKPCGIVIAMVQV